MEITYMVADPAGNITALVISEVPKALHGRVAAKLMERSTHELEQVGFVSRDEDADPTLEMMGGEFCGNAARSFGLYLAAHDLAQRRDQVEIRVSGAGEKLQVKTDPDSGEAMIQMPPVLSVEFKESAVYGRIPLVIMEGIHHALIPGEQPDDEKAGRLLAELKQDESAEALGIMYYDQVRQFMTPLVWVRATDTSVWESSCGSGSVALGAYLNQGRTGAWSMAFNEPGGVIKVEGKGDGTILLSGPVMLSGPFQETIEL